MGEASRRKKLGLYPEQTPKDRPKARTNHANLERVMFQAMRDYYDPSLQPKKGGMNSEQTKGTH